MLKTVVPISYALRSVVEHRAVTLNLRHCLKAFIVCTVSLFQGSIGLMKNECLYACSRER